MFLMDSLTARQWYAHMDLEQITSDLRQQLETWLQAPNSATQGVQEARRGLDALKGVVSARAISAALKSLQSADRDVERARQKEAADQIAASLRPLGINLAAQAPPKRQRKRTSATLPQGLVDGVALDEVVSSEGRGEDEASEPHLAGHLRRTEG